MTGKRRAQPILGATLPVVALVLGIAIGMALRVGSSGSRDEEPEGAAAKAAGGEKAAAPSAGEEEVPTWNVPRSEKSFDELLEPGTPNQLAQLALRLLEADEDELAAAWEVFLPHGYWAVSLRSVLLYRWVALNPEAALAANREAMRTHVTLRNDAWKAWTQLDPRAAFEEAHAMGGRWLHSVLNDIAEAHPEVAVEIMERHPELRTDYALSGLVTAMAKDDPLEAIRFAERHGIGYSQNILKKWVKDDPDAVVAWLAEGAGANYTGSSAAIRSLVWNHPEWIDELEGVIEPGWLRHEFLKAQAEMRVHRDIKAAGEFVSGQEPSRTTWELATTVGKALVESEVGAAMQLLRDTAESARWAHRPLEAFPNGQSFSRRGYNGERPWLEGLVEDHAEEAMELLYGVEIGGGGSGPTMASLWSRHDPEAYADWLGNLEATEVRDGYAERAAGIIRDEEVQDYSARLGFAALIQDEGRQRSMLQEVIKKWHTEQPGEAAEFFGAAGAPAVARGVYERLLEGDGR